MSPTPVLPFAHLLALPKRKATTAAVTRGLKPVRKPAPYKGAAPRPKRTTLASFAHLGQAMSGPARDKDEVEPLTERMNSLPASPRVAVDCDYCEGSGQFGGKTCPLCDGAGFRTLKEVQDDAQSVEDAAATRDRRTAVKMAATASAGPRVRTAAAEIIAAGKRRRGELPASD